MQALAVCVSAGVVPNSEQDGLFRGDELKLLVELGGGLGRLAIRASRALFQFRGAWEDPELMRAFSQRLRARVPVFRIPPDS